MRRNRTITGLTGLLVALTLTSAAELASAQEWLLDESLKTFTNQQRDLLVKGVQKAPEEALKQLLDEETAHLEKLHKDDLEAFAEQALERLLSAREEGHLWKTLGTELRGAGVYSKALLTKVWQEERERVLATFKERGTYALVDHALRAVLIDRLQATRNARLRVWRADASAGTGRPGEFPLALPTERFSWRHRPHDEASVSTSLPLPKVTFWSERAELRETLLKKTYETKLGDLTVTAAEVHGLAEAEAGRVSYKDRFGREIEGLGVDFRAKARVTGARGDLRSKTVRTNLASVLGFSTYLNAMAEVASAADGRLSAIVSEKGFGVNASARVGAGAEARATLPITLDLKVIKLRVIPYANAHAGAGASAHAAFEVEWSGKLRLDVGASLSTGVGAGAGVIIELELGAMLKRALDRLVERIARLTRPIGDFFMGRDWEGPSTPSSKLTLSLSDLERRWAETGAPARPELRDDAAIAARYAPVIYQRVQRGPYDLLRRVDYDGDWNPRNNYDNCQPGSDASAWVYYDVRETETHYYITYGFYHAGRKSNAIKPLRHFRTQENDMGGCIVVARKGAPAGREVEVLITADGGTMRTYSGLERQDGEKTRWSRRHGDWDGEIQFVDEVDHPYVDLERLHPQVWVKGRQHSVYGFNGRDDRLPFEGKPGVIYYPLGEAEQPEDEHDDRVGYALRPLSELLGHEELFAADDDERWVHGAEGRFKLPSRFRGDEGLDDDAVTPFAWGHAIHSESHPGNRDENHRHEWIEAGDTWVDPARTLDVFFRLPDDVSLSYVRNRYLRPDDSRVKQGLSAHLR